MAKQKGKKIVLILNSGTPCNVSDMINDIDAMLWVYFPGQEGGRAAAHILFGDINPSGKLPLTFPKRYQDSPSFCNFPGEGNDVWYGEGIFVGYRWYDKREIEPLFPFGYGLTYGEAAVESACAKWEGSGATVSAVLCNTGNVKICEVLQVYMKCEDHEKAVPNPQLCGFQRVELLPGEKKTVTISIPERSFTVVDDNGCRFIGGEKFSLYVGLSQPDERSIELTGKQPVKIDLCKA